MAEVRLVDVWKKYGNVEAVKNLNLHCKDGEFLALLGPSGCGKTSTLRMIAGLEEITSGSIYIGDKRVNDLPPKEREISLAFENYALYPPLSVFENVAFPLRARGYPEKEIKERVTTILKTFGLWELKDELPSRLSGGQQQLVSLARCLVKDAKVYLLDEAISHLDAELRAYMRAILKKMHSESGKTFIYVTHDQLEAMAMADRVAVLNLGELQQVDTPENIYDHPANLFVASFIGEPPMNFLRGRVSCKNGTCHFTSTDYQIEMPQFTEIKSLQKYQELILGIRPTEIFISTKGAKESHLKAKVLVCEPLGDHTVVTALIGNQRIIIETGASTHIEPDSLIFLELNTEKLRFFDPTSGELVLQTGYKKEV
ncbi:ABC transporter ATP-binding protein [Candidatus Bathyarchaeota archaeon]|nr:ABC transporter ATP-binding protein [Candidatus Bathyarchaeota archaeon]